MAERTAEVLPAVLPAVLMRVGPDPICSCAEPRSVEQFSESDSADQTHFAAWTCALFPDEVTDYAPPLALAQVAVDSDPQNQQYLVGLGAVQMRAGEYEQALASVDQAAGSKRVDSR